MSEMRGEQKAKEREQQKEKEEDYGDSAIGEQCPVAEASLVNQILEQNAMQVLGNLRNYILYSTLIMS